MTGEQHEGYIFVADQNGTTDQETIEVERYRYAGLVLYDISEEQLDRLEQEAFVVGEALTFSAVCLGIVGTALSTLLAVPIQSDRIFYAFLIVTIIAGIGTLFFGVLWLRTRGRMKAVIGRVRQKIGPLGDEGSQIEPTELAIQPSESSETTK